MIPISALLPDELVAGLHLAPPFRGRQIFSWIHQKLVFDFAHMSDLPNGLRASLSRSARPLMLEAGVGLRDPDGTLKLAFRLADGESVEAVLLQDERGRQTACLSTQAGCGMGCRFCRTGRQGYRRDLAAHEIVEQHLLLRAQPPGAASRQIANVVFMGMGEPLANIDNLERAVRVLCHPAGSALSPRRLTVSTCGLVEGIRRLAGRGLALRLAVSLICADPRLRRELMPVTRTNPLPELRQALLEYQQATGRRITLEIVLLAGINDRSEDVEAAISFVRGPGSSAPLKVLVNLIAWNPLPEFPFRRPDAKRMEWFRQRLRQAGVPVTTRLSRGSAVCGACGQLG